MLKRTLNTLRRAESSITALHQRITELEELVKTVQDPDMRTALDNLISKLTQELNDIESAVKNLRAIYASERSRASW